MRTYARAYKDIWNEQFSGVLSLDLHRENKTEAKKVCLLIDLVSCNWEQNKQLKLNSNWKAMRYKINKNSAKFKLGTLFKAFCFYVSISLAGRTAH